MIMTYNTVLVTGAAGFIGLHLSQRLLAKGCRVVGVDIVSPYYDVVLKEDRLKQLDGKPGFTFYRTDIADKEGMDKIFNDHPIDVVVNLAAQAGVRYSLQNPGSYIEANLTGFGNLLEGCRHHSIRHLVFASSSSVYGANTKMPFSVHHNVDHPVSLYAATKKANELMAHSYSHLFGLCCTGLRFFTVYGPWGRPDMALFLFTKAILEGNPIKVFNQGKMKRDFTYIDDIVDGIIRVLPRIPEPNPDWSGKAPDPASSYTGYKLYNIGNNRPVELLEFINVLEKTLGQEAKKEFMDLQPGDVIETYADIDDLVNDTGFSPGTPIEAGIPKFVEWYREYYKNR